MDDESFTGTRVIHFTSRGGHIVYCGKYLGKKYLTEWEGQMGKYIIWPEFMTCGPRAVSSVRHDQEANVSLLERHKSVLS